MTDQQRRSKNVFGQVVTTVNYDLALSVKNEIWIFHRIFQFTNMNSNFFLRKSGDVVSSNVSEVESSESSESTEVFWEVSVFSGRRIVLLPTHIWARP